MSNQSSGNDNEEFSSHAEDNADEGAYIVFPSSTAVPLFHLPVAIRATAIHLANLDANSASNLHAMNTDVTFHDWDVREDESFDAWDIDAEEFPDNVQQCRFPVASAAA